MLGDLCIDALLDTVRLIPFLFVTYLAMEYLEHRTQEASRQMVKKAGRFGPLIGGITGMVPQCGFSAAASGLYAGGVISVGTLIAIFLSTSDEMLPIFISQAVHPLVIGKILGLKVIIGAVSGFAVDAVWKSANKKGYTVQKQRPEEHHHCGCEEGSIFQSALLHTAQITVFIFLVSFLIGFLVESAGHDRIAALIVSQPVLGVFLTGLVGMIPNCASSVIITQMYLEGILGAGQMMAGLLAGAGVGLLVLFRTNKGIKENLTIGGVLYGVSVAWGILMELLGIGL